MDGVANIGWTWMGEGFIGNKVEIRKKVKRKVLFVHPILSFLLEFMAGWRPDEV